MLPKREDGPLKWNLNSALAVAGFGLTLLVQIIGGTVLWTNNVRDVKDLNNQVTSLNQALNTQMSLVNKRLDSEAEDRKDRIKDFTKTQTDMQTQIAAYTPLSYQVTQALTLGTENKEANKQTNIRIDRVVDTMNGKLDSVLDGLSKLTSSVAVLSSRMDTSSGIKKSVDPINIPFRP